jgi:hypothetical protein
MFVVLPSGEVLKGPMTTYLLLRRRSRASHGM